MLILKTITRSFNKFPLPYIGIILLWVSAILIVHPFSNLPFGDEFAYIKPVQHYLQTGSMKYTDWSSMTLILQVWIGAVVSWLFGFSITTLRLISQAFAVSAVLALYMNLQLIGTKRLIAFLLSILMLFNPLYFQIGVSFVTDIPFLGIFLWAVYFMLRYFETAANKYYVMGLLCTIAAFFIRDVAVVLPPAFAFALLLQKGFTKRTILLSLVYILLLVCCYFGWRWWLANIHGLPKNIDFSRNRMLETLTSPVKIASALSRNTIYTLGYVGMYCVPLLPIALLAIKRYFTRSQLLIVGIFAAALCIVILSINKVYGVLLTHVWDGFTISFNSGNVYSMQNESFPYVTEWVKKIITCCAVVSGVCIVLVIVRYLWVLGKNIRHKQLPVSVIFLAGILCIYGILMFTQWMIPRYYLVMIPFILMLFYKSTEDLFPIIGPVVRNSVLGFLLAVVYISFSFVHDTFARHRAYMAALDYVENQCHATYWDIDGGFDYNSWKNYYYHYKSTPDKNWWWVENPKFVLTDGHIPSMQLLKVVSYYRWYQPGFIGYVYVHRNPAIP